MANKYVDNLNGDDTTGDGSSGNPYETIQKAIDVSTGGDTIWLADTQIFTLSASLTWNTGFGTTSADAPLIIRGWDNGGSLTIPHPSGTNLPCAVISGNNAVTTASAATSRPTNVILYRLHLKQFTAQAIILTSYCSVIECEFSESGTSSYMLDASSGLCKILSSYFHDHNTAAGSMTIAGTNHVIGNYINTPKARGIQGSGPNLIMNNILYNCKDHGMVFTSDHNTIISNTVIGDGTTASKYGIHLSSGSAEISMFSGNLIQDFAGSGAIGIYLASGANGDILGPNAYHNNTTNFSSVSTFTGLNLTGNDVTDGSDPLEDKANGNFKVKVTANCSNGSPFITGYLGSETEQVTAYGATDSQESETGAVSITAGDDNAHLGDC